MMTLGIDPGLSGAIAAVRSSPLGEHHVHGVWDMPTHTITVGRKERRRLDLHALARLLEGLAIGGPVLCAIEDLSGRPSTVRGKDGELRVQAGLWEQGFNCCAPIACAAALNLPYQLVTPRSWKATLGVPADKDGARRAASQRLPAAAGHWARVKDDGRAEAALLALWAYYATTREVPPC